MKIIPSVAGAKIRSSFHVPHSSISGSLERNSSSISSKVPPPFRAGALPPPAERHGTRQARDGSRGMRLRAAAPAAAEQLHAVATISVE